MFSFESLVFSVWLCRQLVRSCQSTLSKNLKNKQIPTCIKVITWWYLCSQSPTEKEFFNLRCLRTQTWTLKRVFVAIFVCQNLSFRSYFFFFFFFAVEPLMIASLTLPGVLVQQVSLFISSPFSLIAPGCWLLSLGLSFVTRETPSNSKRGAHLPGRSSI